MTTIGYATLQIIPSLQGVTEAIEKQVEGKVVNVTIEPKVDERASEAAGKKTRETVEKHTKAVTVEPKVDQRAAEETGKKTGEAVAKGASGSSSAVGQAIIGALQGAGEEGGRLLGEKLAQQIPTGLTGAAQRIGTALRNSLPTAGAAAGTALATAIGIALTDAIGKQRLDTAGRAVMNGLTKAVKAANNATEIGVAIGNSVAGGLTNASGVIGGAAATITNTLGGITSGVDAAKQLLGGNDSWAAPGLDTLNSALGSATPLLTAMNGAATLASAGAQSISVATGIASKAQLLWNAALIANPIGLIVAAIAAVVAGLVLFFTKTELGRKIWAGFTEYLKIAWEAIKGAFSAAWDVISAIWDGMVAGARAVWDGVKAQFTAVVDFVKGLPGAIGNAAKGMWDGISNAFKSMIDKLKSWWNSFASALSFTVPDLPGIPGRGETINPIPQLSTGGYTGSVPIDQVAGVVHGGEYVIKASSTSGIQNAYPGLLDYLNGKGALPGFKDGGKVQLGNISGPGITTGEQQSMWDAIRGNFPEAVLSSATRTVMTEGHPDFHNAGRAIDISGPGMGSIASWIASNYPDSLELIHSPFGHNIKNGKDVGDGTAFYGSGLMAAHGNHVHWALGKAAKPSASAPAAGPESSTLSTLGVDAGGASAPSTAAPAAEAASGSSSITLASSFSGLSAMGGEQLGKFSPVVSPDGKTESLDKIGSAAGQVAAGQVSSALGVLGINDSPGWLKGVSQFVSGIKIGGGSGGGGPLGGDVSPAAAVSPALSAAGGAINGIAGGAVQQPGPQVNYNIRTAAVEDAFLASQRIEKERAAATLARY